MTQQPATFILYYGPSQTAPVWALKSISTLEARKQQLDDLPKRCYIFLPEKRYPQNNTERQEILRHFDAPPVLATEMCTKINGYFGSKSKYDDKDKLRSYSTWMRCLVKMLYDDKLPDEKFYRWYEMTFLSRWDYIQGTHQVLCIDTPEDFPMAMLNALQGRNGEPHIHSGAEKDYFKDPFSMYGALLDQVVELNDHSVWNIRHPIRKIEQIRPTAHPDFEVMHETSRHSIHVSEVLLVTIQNFEMLREEQQKMHDQAIEPCVLKKEYRQQAHEYLNFQIQMLKSLRERSISNHSRLTSEITVAYNRIVQQDNRVMKAIAFLTMTFLPAAFISVESPALCPPWSHSFDSDSDPDSHSDSDSDSCTIVLLQHNILQLRRREAGDVQADVAILGDHDPIDSAGRDLLAAVLQSAGRVG